MSELAQDLLIDRLPEGCISGFVDRDQVDSDPAGSILDFEFKRPARSLF